MTIQPITYDLLREKGASPNLLKAFCDAFGVSVHLTVESAIEHAHAIDWDWAAPHLLSDSARDAYNKAIAPAWDDYHKAIASARYDYLKAIAPALDDYHKAIAPAWDAYLKARAEAFARAYLSQENDQ